MLSTVSYSFCKTSAGMYLSVLLIFGDTMISLPDIIYKRNLNIYIKLSETGKETDIFAAITQNEKHGCILNLRKCFFVNNGDWIDCEAKLADLLKDGTERKTE